MIVSMKDVENRLTELARLVEGGKVVVVTRNGKPVLDLVPHRQKSGLDFDAGYGFLRAKGIENPVPFIADDFDESLPEDVPLRSLPEA